MNAAALGGSVLSVWIIFLRPLAKDMAAIGDKVTSMDISVIDMNLALTKHIAEDGKTQLKIEYLEAEIKELKSKQHD